MESLSVEQIQKCKDNKEKWYDYHICKMEIGKEVREANYGCMNFYTNIKKQETEKQIFFLVKPTEKCRIYERDNIRVLCRKL